MPHVKDELRRLSHVSQLFPLPRCQFPKSFSSLAEIQSHLAAVELGILTVDRPGKDPAEAAAFPSTQAPAEAFQLPPAPGQRTPPPADLRPERALTSPGIHSFTPSPPPKADAGEALVPEEAIECELERLRVFRWNIRCTFMAILSVRADFCQAQHSVFADK
ncbi:uncharacterized protein LOC144334525 isoform X1 [Macaca mulatta]